MSPRSVTSSPTAAELQQQEADANSHVTRGEFRALRADVHEIKEALIGDMNRGGVLEQHRDMRRKMALVSKVAWAGTLGALALAGKAFWDQITIGKH